MNGELDHLFQYRGEFNPAPVRAMLGLDGYQQQKLSDVETIRLAELLRRANHLSDEDLVQLGLVAIPHVNEQG